MEAEKFVNFETIDIQTKGCVSDEERQQYMEYAISRVQGRIQPGPDRGSESIAVVCYGPSLRDDVEKLRDFKWIITCSGAHRYLIDRGIIPTWHVDVDPREHKIELLGTPHPDVEYLMCSSVNPKYIDALAGHNVKLWHGYSGVDMANLPAVYPRGEWVFAGGCTVGLRALILARFLGFTNIDLFGMDCSYPDGQEGEHADVHPNPSKEVNKVVVEYQGVKYKTTVAMIEYARQFFNELTLLPDIKIAVHGIGFLQHLAFTGWKPNNVASMRSQSIIAFNAPELISKEYLKQNRLLHEANPAYGISGSKWASTVVKLANIHGTTDVLDYGCGKGTLAANLPFKIKEYDPAVAGKESSPYPADIVVCTDVLEHIEPEYLSNVLSDIVRCTKKIAFLAIATGPAKKTLPDGRNTHLIQQGKTWWWKQLDNYFQIDDIDEEAGVVTAVVKPKHTSIGAIDAVDKQGLSFNFIDVEGIKFVVNNKSTSWRATTLLTKEPHTIDWLNTMVPGDILLDIGANVGPYSLWAAKKRGINVYAFEPESQNYSTLMQNILINECSGKIHAYCLGLSDRIEAGTLNLTDFVAGGSCHQFNSELNYNGVKSDFVFKQSTMAFTVDWLVESGLIPQPSHVKIDIDGLEPRVVHGAVKTLLRCKSILIEVNTNLSAHLSMIKLLEALGYTYDPAAAAKNVRTTGPFTGVGEYVFWRN